MTYNQINKRLKKIETLTATGECFNARKEVLKLYYDIDLADRKYKLRRQYPEQKGRFRVVK